jgi:hypothetical protein
MGGAAQVQGRVHIDVHIHHVVHPVVIQVVRRGHRTQSFIDELLHVEHVDEAVLIDIAQPAIRAAAEWR